MEPDLVSIRYFIERIFEERNRASIVADTEREKSARVLADNLAQSIKEGDDRLREHILNQIAQIAAALESAGALELERFERAKFEVEAMRREMKLIQDAQSAAVQKAEESQKEVNYRNNQFRGQLSDQAATLMPRKETEALVKELRIQLDKADDKVIATNTRIEQWDSRRVGTNETRAGARATIGQIVSVISAAVAVIGLMIVLANVLTTH